ncbi:MAG: glycosyltransferase [Phycisphaerales bacterium]|nr:MAG: glycosyltransferase [Phycisphaerales bacterium]
MNPAGVAAFLRQDYTAYRLYVLDDSTATDEIERVDALRRRWSGRFDVIRRETRTGFKAGNLNHALRELGDSYKYICVVDADEVIPADFLRRLVAVAEARDGLGFVQAAHTQYSTSRHARLTGDGIDPHWRYFLPARNRFGFVHFYGHGALLNVKAVLSVGGFPEVVSEDIALAARLREAGFRGYFASHVTSLEECPPSYEAFRRRSGKILAGTLQFLFQLFPSFLRSSRVPLVEKIDVLVSASVMYLPIFYLMFVFLLHAGILCAGTDPLARTGTQPSTGAQQSALSIRAGVDAMLGWPTVALVCLTIFAPFVYLIPNTLRNPRKVLPYCFRMGAVHLSTCLATLGATYRWLTSRRNCFVPTGDRTYHRKPNGRIECVVGLSIVLMSLFVGSPCLGALGLSLMMVPCLMSSDFEFRKASVFLCVPMLLTLVALFGPSFGLVAMSGVLLGLGFVHL